MSVGKNGSIFAAMLRTVNVTSYKYDHKQPMFDQTLLMIISFCCATVMVTLCLVGIVGNCISIYIFTRKVMHSSINVLLAGLSCIDLCLLVIVIPIFALPALNIGDNKFITEFCHVLVVYVYPVSMMLQTSSVWLFLAITAERFLAVCMPLKVKIYCSPSRSRRCILVILLLAALYNFVRFWEYELVHFAGNSSGNGSDHDRASVVSMPRIRDNPHYWLWYGTVSYLLTQFLLPFLIIAVLNGVMIITIMLAKRRRALLTMTERSEHKTTLMMLLVIVVFVGCYTLSFMLNFLEYISPKWSYSTLGLLLNDISNTLITFNSAVTWLIYTVFSKRYRYILKWLVLRNVPKSVIKPCLSADTFQKLADRCSAGLGQRTRIDRAMSVGAAQTRSPAVSTAHRRRQRGFWNGVHSPAGSGSTGSQKPSCETSALVTTSSSAASTPLIHGRRQQQRNNNPKLCDLGTAVVWRRVDGERGSGKEEKKRSVTFEDECGRTAVTLDGPAFSPDGVLTYADAYV